MTQKPAWVGQAGRIPTYLGEQVKHLKKYGIAGAVGVALIVGTTACGHDNFRDVKGIGSRSPDRIEVISNVDRNPNVAVLCIHGAGFASTTRDFTSLIRVEAWDKLCPPATPITGVAR